MKAPGCIDLIAELRDDALHLRWTCVSSREICEARIPLPQLIAMAPGAPTEPLAIDCRPLDTAIAATRARVEGLRKEREEP